MIRFTEKEARELLGDRYGPPAKKNKYNARKTVVDGITFDSQKEAEYYCQLKLRKKAGEITDFELQPVFILQEKYRLNGKTIRAMKYKADFKVFYPDGRVEIVDVKGYRNQLYRNKIKQLLDRYPDIWFTEA